jgi:hypothetical protein
VPGAVDGDFYLDITDGEVWELATGTWGLRANITGPPGPQGEQGAGLIIQGTVPDSSSLPTVGNEVGDCWIAADTGHGWSWDGTQWVDIGPIQGPAGATGPTGPEGPEGPQGPPGITVTTIASFDIPPVGQTIVINVEDTAWAIVGQLVYIEDRDLNEAIPMEVTAKTATTLTLRTPPTYPTAVSQDVGNLLTTGSDSLPFYSNGAGSTDWADITGKPATFPPTLPIAQSGVTNLTTDLAAKEPTISAGTTAQYWRGDKTWTTFPTIPADDVIGGIITIGNTAPVSPAVGDVWIDTT